MLAQLVGRMQPDYRTIYLRPIVHRQKVRIFTGGVYFVYRQKLPEVRIFKGGGIFLVSISFQNVLTSGIGS